MIARDSEMCNKNIGNYLGLGFKCCEVELLFKAPVPKAGKRDGELIIHMFLDTNQKGI